MRRRTALGLVVLAIAIYFGLPRSTFDADPSLASAKTKHAAPSAASRALRWAGAHILNPLLAKFAQRSLPQISGEIVIPGDVLWDEVKVSRDAHGVPHIEATSLHDATLAQGFVHCQDRLWQLNTNRLLASGKLSEHFGPDALDTDRLARTLGFAFLAKQDWARLVADSGDDPEADAARTAVEAYADGINACIAGHRGPNARALPLEFTLAGIAAADVAPWTAVDVMAWARLLGWQMSEGWNGEIARHLVAEKVGAARAAELAGFMAVNATHPAHIARAPLGAAAVSASRRLQETVSRGMGSNGWVVSGKHTATGAPLLANDPHLVLSNPSIWYQCAMRVSPPPSSKERALAVI